MPTPYEAMSNKSASTDADQQAQPAGLRPVASNVVRR